MQSLEQRQQCEAGLVKLFVDFLDSVKADTKTEDMPGTPATVVEAIFPGVIHLQDEVLTIIYWK